MTPNLAAGRLACLSLLVAALQIGCGGVEEKPAAKKAKKPAAKKLTAAAPVKKVASPVVTTEPPATEVERAAPAEPPKPEPLDPMRFVFPEVDEAKREGRGIRKLESRHLTLYTDVSSSPAVDELPQVFDQAVPQWLAYFGIEPERGAKWKMVGMLVAEKERFFDTGLWPEDLPPFLHGYMIDNRFWLYEQPSDFYRRELLLHEGTHGFMWAFLGGMGPPWYAEGTAELLGTHSWEQERLTLGTIPPSKEASPMWGRVKVLKDAYAEKSALPLITVMQTERPAFMKPEAYAWCWGAAVFFDHDPKYQDAYRKMQAMVNDTSHSFSARLLVHLSEPREQVLEQWQCFVANMEYGYDVARESIVRKPPERDSELSVAADRGWQSTGYAMKAGNTYELTASGRFQIGESTKPWISEAGGITLRYFNGRPIGMLLAAVTDEGKAGGVSPLLNPIAIGSEGKITPEKDGVLYLRVNDSPAALHDNAGHLTVTIRAAD